MNRRLHHLDALRAMTMVLILPVHAVVIVGLNGGWNKPESAFFWLVASFRVPLFFLLAGFFAALLVEKRGSRDMIRNRLTRIGVPLLAAVIAIVPFLSLALRQVSAVDSRAVTTGLNVFVNPYPHYVWFLWYLMLFYCGALLLRQLLVRLPTGKERLQRLGSGFLSHWIAPLLLAIPCALLLYRQHTWIAQTPAETFVPRPDLFAYYATFFACGWVLFSVNGIREAIEGRPGRYAALAAIALPPALALYLSQGVPGIGDNRWVHLLALGLFSITTWALVFCLLGASRRLLREPSSRLRYWADASYWIYLSHFPVMATLAILLFALPLPNALRIGLMTCVTFALVFPAYGAFVRHSAIGRVLHGPRPHDERSRRRWSLTRPGVAAGPQA